MHKDIQPRIPGSLKVSLNPQKDQTQETNQMPTKSVEADQKIKLDITVEHGYFDFKNIKEYDEKYG